MPKRTPPAFQLYASSFIAGTLSFSPAEIGAYFRLLLHEWESGFVPGDDLQLLARVMGCEQSEASVLWSKISHKFRRNSRGEWTNKRLETEREKQRRFSKSQSDKGKLRWAQNSRGLAGAQPRVCPVPVGSLTGTSTSTAALARREFPQVQSGTKTPKAPKATAWKRGIAIAHAVMDQFPERQDWTPEFKQRAGQQRLPYTEVDEFGRPFYARVLDYVEEVRRRRRSG